MPSTLESEERGPTARAQWCRQRFLWLHCFLGMNSQVKQEGPGYTEVTPVTPATGPVPCILVMHSLAWSQKYCPLHRGVD